MSTTQHPALWAVFADNGNVRLWSTDHAEVRAFAEGIGQPLIALYPGPPAQPAPHDDPIGNACRLLREAAQEYAEGVSVNGVPDWKNEPDTHSAYIEHITAAHRLEQWAASIGAGGVEPLRSRQCLHQIAEPAAVAVPGWKLLPIDPTLELLCATMSDGEEDAARGLPQEHMQLLLERAGIRARYARILAAAPTTQAAPGALSQAAQDVLAELERATRKFPTWPTDPLHALAVLGEEFGELTKDMLQLTYEPHKTNAANVRTEALQTAAMALRLFMSLDRYEYRPGVQHSQQEGGAA